MIPAIDRLEVLMNAALDRVDKKECTLALALAERMGEVIHALADLAISSDVSPSMRQRASALLFAAWSKVTKLESKQEDRAVTVAKAAARREQFTAKAARLKNEAAEKQRRDNRVKEQKAKRLAEILSQVDKQVGANDGE